MSELATNRPKDEPARSNSTFAWLNRLAKKELYEILRDRRTVITLVLMPLLVYPLLSVAFRTLALSGMSASTAEGVVWAVEFQTYEQAAAVDQVLGGELTKEDIRTSKYRADLANANGKPITPPTGPLWFITYQGGSPARIQQNVTDGATDLGVIVLAQANPKDAQPMRIELVASESSVSRDIRDWFATRLNRVNEEYQVKQLERLNQKVTSLVQFEERRTKPAEKVGAISFAALMPLILVLMTITGAVYPAIDLTAGERERNTLEALIASPAPRFALLLAKYTAVLTVAMLTALMNLIAMSTTIWLLGLGKDIFGASGFSIFAIVQVAGLMMLFAAFFSGVLLAVTSFARSFKEAQAYLIPLMLVALAPGMMSLMPGIKLEGPLVVAPLVNLVLLTRDLLLNKASNEVALIVVASNALYAMAALALAAKVFGADSVLYGREGSWAELFTRPRETAKSPSMSAAFFCLAALFVMTFLAQSVMGMLFKSSPGQPLRLEGPIIASGVGNLLIFGGVCLAFAWLGRVSLRAILPIRPPSISIGLATVIFGLASWPIAHEILAWMNDLGIAAISQTQLKNTAKLMPGWEQVSPVITLLSIAIITPIGEEIAFRGYLFSAFQSKKHPWRVVLISSALFAAFHVVSPGVLSFERFAPSFFLGLILGCVRYKSCSIWPSIAIHMIHNGLLQLALANRESLEKLGLGANAESLHLPIAWQLGSLAAVATAFSLVWASRRPTESKIAPAQT